MHYFKIKTFFTFLSIGYSFCTTNTSSNNFAVDLIETAEKAGVNFTINDLDIAQSAANNDEIVEVFPLPVAQKLIGHRNRNEMNTVREQMIGMIFTGEPISLGSFVNPTRRAFRTRPKKRPAYSPRFDMQDMRPHEILKPLSFLPEPSNIKLPSPRTSSSSLPRVPLTKRRHNNRPRRPISKSFRNHLQTGSRKIRPTTNLSFGKRNPFGREEFSHGENTFGNTVGSDFGPVTYETFGAHEQEPDHFEPHRIPHKNKPHQQSDILQQYFKPSEKVPPFGYTTTKFGFTKKPNDVGQIHHSSPPKPDIGTSFGPSYNKAGACIQYTDEICLDTDNYPHEAILSSLVHDPSRADNMMAEVREQSADTLVDGLTAAQESKYDYTHYFGNRRQDSSKQTERDFASDGGYLCPSEVKYARPKRARNSKGDWKFIVNMDKYTQTIRMEKCMKAGGTCSYISHHYYAICNQISNYQRLLSWEKKKGLHMDIYKVPSCCSCHIQGYAYIFPPLHGSEGDFASSRKVEDVVKPTIRKIDKLNKALSPETKSKRPSKNGKRRPGRLPNRRRPVTTTNRDTPRRRFDQRPPINRKGNPQRVNYAYHPIIDFFKQ